MKRPFVQLSSMDTPLLYFYFIHAFLLKKSGFTFDECAL